MASIHGASWTGGEQVTGEWYCPAPWNHWKNCLRQVAQAVCRAVSERVRPEPEEQRAAVNQRAETLLKTHGPGILRFAYSYLHNMAVAEVILQDTLIQFLKTASVLETEAHEKAWLYRVAGNLSKNRIAYNRVRTAELQTSKTTIVPMYRRLAVAACAALLLAGAVALPYLSRERAEEGSPSGDQSGLWERTEAASPQELSQLVGFPVETLGAVPFEMTDVQYTAYGGGLAETTYSDGEQSLVFRKTMGQTDPSGDYTAYEVQTTVEVDSSTVTLHGMEDGYCLAVWQDGTYSWSIRSATAYSIAVWTEILESVE